ncbi:DUF2017 family protein [Cryobacterium sp. Y11]|uniref:DUF2017 family protein n=1 Tax=Cryobacterium sp. Y11 TaxID=2045016 RepID=UPI000CE3EEF7|nr:DUF2017 family protein [Cryobacterium sp. Y11]
MSAIQRFTVQQDGALLGRFEPIEVDLLRLATTQLLEMLDSGTANPELAATDGIFGRLLPDAYRDDDEAAAEFRRYTSVNLLAQKALNAQTVLSSLHSDVRASDPIASLSADETDVSAADTADRQPYTVSIDPDAVQAWLRSLTDLRLTLADRLQISPDGVVNLATEDTPFLRELYDWLGMLQEELVYAIDI